MLDLTEENIKLKHQQDGTQKTKCPQCQPPHNKNDNPLTVSISENGNSIVWYCHHCNWKGSKFNSENYAKNNWNIKKNQPKYEKPVIENKTYNDFMYDYFKKRCISKSTVNDFKIFNDGEWIGFPYFDEKSEIKSL